MKPRTLLGDPGLRQGPSIFTLPWPHAHTPGTLNPALALTLRSREVIHKKLGNSKLLFPQQPALRPFG